jgi:hypothetical protein
MTSNVVALPGIGLGPHTPVRPAANSHAAVTTAANDQDGQHQFPSRDKDVHEHGGDAPKSAPSRPQSPVSLNTLLAAQEQGGEAGTTETPTAPAKNDALQATQLNEGEQKQVQELKAADAEIHRHEQAHAAAGGQYAGAPQYEYTNGPDGKRYATSGHVAIDVAPVAGDPKATIEKMDVVQRAANAPAEPSGADRSVAAKAAALKQTAQAELSKAKAEELAIRNGAPDVEGANTGADEGAGFVEGFAFPDAAKKDVSPEQDKPAAPSIGISPAAAAAAYAATPLNSVAEA